MDDANQKQKILQMLAQNEELLADLYRTYAQKFRRHRNFWLKLAREETLHASIIRSIPAKSGHTVEVKEDRFNNETLQISLDYVQEKLAQARNKKISHKQAMSTALDIETGMLERGYLNVFEGDSIEFKQTLYQLAAETRTHTNRIRQRLSRKRWRFSYENATIVVNVRPHLWNASSRPSTMNHTLYPIEAKIPINLPPCFFLWYINVIR